MSNHAPISVVLDTFRTEVKADYLLVEALRSKRECNEYCRQRLRRIVKDVDKSASSTDMVDAVYKALLDEGGRGGVVELVKRIEFRLNTIPSEEKAPVTQPRVDHPSQGSVADNDLISPLVADFRAEVRDDYVLVEALRGGAEWTKDTRDRLRRIVRTVDRNSTFLDAFDVAHEALLAKGGSTQVRDLVKHIEFILNTKLTEENASTKRLPPDHPSLPVVTVYLDISHPPLSPPPASSFPTARLTQAREYVAEKPKFSPTSALPHSYQPTAAPRPGPSPPTYVTPSGRSQGIDWSSRPTVSTRFRDLVFSHKYLPTAIQERGKSRADKTVQQQFYNIIEQIDPSILKDPIAMAIFRRGDISIVDLYLTLEDFLVNATPDHDPEGLFRWR